MSHFGRKAAMGAVAFAMVGSTVFGGAALANGTEEEGAAPTVANSGGPGGQGGAAALECFNLVVQISVLNYTEEGGDQNAEQSCTVTGGAGGTGGTGAAY